MAFRRTTACTLACLAALLPAAALAQSPTSWKLATGYRADSFHTRNIDAFARDVGSATQGALTIQVFPNNALARLADIPAAVQGGQAEAGEVIMSGMVKELPMMGADSVPFVTASYADAQKLWRLQRPVLEKAMQARGLTLLYAVAWPPQGLYTTRPIRQASDFKGMKMRTYNATTVRVAQMLGATAVDVPMVEVDRALAEGRLDSMITSALTGVENKVWTGLKYYYEINAWFPKNMVFVRTTAYEALAPATRDAVMAAARTAEARGWEASKELALNTVEELRRNGMKIERTPPELDREIKRMGERFSREWVHTVGNEANYIFTPYFLN